MYTAKDVAVYLKLDVSVADSLAKHIFPNKVLFSKDDVFVMKEYYSRWGSGAEFDGLGGPYEEYLKLERIKALLMARVEMVSERQAACVIRMESLRKLDNSIRQESKALPKAAGKLFPKKPGKAALAVAKFLAPRGKD